MKWLAVAVVLGSAAVLGPVLLFLLAASVLGAAAFAVSLALVSAVLLAVRRVLSTAA
ncbi:MAG: hypothetical protein PHS14_11675 [Elusimicrobia bacterium]|nr:hypothetical protein [Elusimicrobiota bacterium]